MKVLRMLTTIRYLSRKNIFFASSCLKRQIWWRFCQLMKCATERNKFSGYLLFSSSLLYFARATNDFWWNTVCIEGKCSEAILKRHFLSFRSSSIHRILSIFPAKSSKCVEISNWTTEKIDPFGYCLNAPEPIPWYFIVETYRRAQKTSWMRISEVETTLCTISESTHDKSPHNEKSRLMHWNHFGNQQLEWTHFTHQFKHKNWRSAKRMEKKCFRFHFSSS